MAHVASLPRSRTGLGVEVGPQECGEDLFVPLVGRGAAFADIDADGDLDVLLAGIASPPRLLRNDLDLDHHWLRLKLVGGPSNRDAIGARIEIRLEDRTIRRQVMPTRSFLSQVELPVTVGLGLRDRVEAVRITWPDGQVQEVREVALDRLTVIRQQP